MLEGISTDQNCESSAACLSASKSFVARYYSRTTQIPSKPLKALEAQTLAQAGLDLVVVYQDRAREMVDFSFSRGELDATSAIQAAASVGQPFGSGIYFAVDTDVTEQEIADHVLPYFQGVAAAMSKLSDGEAHYRIGVYGSGRSCRRVKQDGLATLTWLAESKGWLDSSTYEDWDIKQFRTKELLCNLKEESWERCIAKGDYGQFKPIGCELSPEQAEVKIVTANSLNLRKVPTKEGNTPIAALPHGTKVYVLGKFQANWARVRTSLNGADFVGYVHTAYLGDDLHPTGEAETTTTRPALPPAYWKPNNPDARRSSTSNRASVIGEQPRPARDGTVSAATKVAQLTEIVEWLDVAASERYQKEDGKTFCNVYAADFCYLAGVYLPRVWWTGAAIARIGAGENVTAAYGSTVREMRADDLYRWLLDFGNDFGWQRVTDVGALQQLSNQGHVGLICADRAADGLPGHITVVVPETDSHHAVRDSSGTVTQPLQSQAGGSNFKYGSSGPNWWLSTAFVDHVFFSHP